MPLPWLWIGTPTLPRLPEPPRLERSSQTTRIDDELVVTWHKQEIEIANEGGVRQARLTRFTGGVEATYGPTKIMADELVLYLLPSERHGVATGHVRLIDPEATASASRIEFDWRQKTGRADNVDAQIENVIMRAERIDIRPGLWQLTNVVGTNCSRRPPVYAVSADRVDIRPGHAATFHKPTIRIFNKPVLTLKRHQASLDRRATGIRPPWINFRRGVGLGLAWDNSVLLNDQTALAAAFGAFPKHHSGYRIQVARSWVDPERADQLITPASELSERAGVSYFENVAVASPDADAAYLRLPRKALSLGSFVGLAASGRDEGAGYGKPLELVGDWGGPLGSAAGFLVQARWQRIRRNYDPIYSREVVQAAVGLRPIPISRNLDVTLRADSAGYSGGGTNFAWARGLAGLSWRPSKHLWLALAGTTSSESGAALFPADQLPVKRSLAGRVDVAFGGFRLSLLNKVDPSTHVRFDREYSVSQVIGCAEVYSQFRRSPNEYKIGLRLRLESFFDALQSRKTRRKGEAAPP